MLNGQLFILLLFLAGAALGYAIYHLVFRALNRDFAPRTFGDSLLRHGLSFAVMLLISAGIMGFVIMMAAGFMEGGAAAGVLALAACGALLIGALLAMIVKMTSGGPQKTTSHDKD